MRVLAAAVLVVLILAGCGGTGAAESSLTPQNEELTEQGETLYQANCARCHGTDLRGTSQGPSMLSEVYVPGHHADAAFLIAVQRGSAQHHWRFGDMPAVEGLSTDDVGAIVAFVRETQRIQGFEPYPP
ncbi:MAG: cytochrome c [Acidimicrobiia bacterium]|nr:cytochrome c [Acidimicrobiia bacterium]NNF10094.1 cytochrome c [Acidimicrobiia bacterium]NNL68608.1 cytochrome c [Acidimicrobiia bacterium]